MPTILFLMKYPLHRRDNLQTKFDGQMEAARQLGWDAWCIGWDESGMVLIGKEKRIPLKKNQLTRMPGYDHTKIFIDLMAAVRQAMRHIHIDVLYMRYMPTFAGAVQTMRKLKAQGGKLVMEYPTYPKDQENARFFLRRQVFRYADRVLAKINPMVDLYTLVGAPCKGSLHGRPAINIVNGVTVETLPLHTPNTDTSTVRLLALASMSAWQGYDRLLTALAAYNGNTNVQLAFVGGEGDGSLAQWQALCAQLKLDDRVTFHGPLFGEALDAVIAQCDVGVCSLGLYRYSRSHVMALKLREYMARGLPFLLAVDDPALPTEHDFALKVPDDDTPIDMEAIVAFALQCKRDADLPARMRTYAQQHMSWAHIFEAVLTRVAP